MTVKRLLKLKLLTLILDISRARIRIDVNVITENPKVPCDIQRNIQQEIWDNTMTIYNKKYGKI